MRLYQDCYETVKNQDCYETVSGQKDARGGLNQSSSSGHVAPSYNIVRNINIDIDMRNTDLRWSEKEVIHYGSPTF